MAFLKFNLEYDCRLLNRHSTGGSVSPADIFHRPNVALDSESFGLMSTGKKCWSQK